MRKLLLIAITILCITSCKEDNKKKVKILPQSASKINTLSVVMDNELWENSVGETLREVLAAPVDGLPQEEPLFSMNQIPTEVFSGFARNNRSIIKVEKGTESGVKIFKDKYARPQKLIVVSGTSISDIKAQIKDNADLIVKAFKEEEIKEYQRRIAKSLHNTDDIKEKLGIDIRFSKAYRIAKAEDKFFWIRKDIPTGTLNLMLYELPLKAINKDENIISQIIKIRDSVGKVHIEGPVEGSYMATEMSYAPYLLNTTIDNKPTLEAKGIWDVKGAWKAGPFINYSIEDKANNRIIIAEGFVDAPSISKREHVFELEAMIKSIKIQE
ncbi:DUF4837 family protein [Pontimicrobium sp. MEBiC06410]|jgi:hypothetical protein